MPEKILVVDDNESATHMTARMLSGLGYEVLTADNGPSALAQVAGQHPDCILLDIMMPRMSGLEVLSRLKHDPATKGIPVILLTAKSQDEGPHRLQGERRVLPHEAVHLAGFGVRDPSRAGEPPSGPVPVLLSALATWTW